jgi:predicted Rossmann fold nucleotide-binding protein DprA/Smf involved in DNA uptake
MAMSSCNLKQLWALAWLFPKITEKHVLQLFANGFQLNDSGLQQCLPDLCHWFALTESEVARRWSQCAEEFSLLMSMGANLLTPSCDGYPAKLKFRCSRPPVLSVSGDPSLLSLRGLAVVGSR